MAKNKHKEKAMQSLAQKAAKKSVEKPVEKKDDTLGKETPATEETKEETKVETKAQVDNKPAEAEKPVETPTETPTEKPAEPAKEKKEEKKETKEEKKARQKAEYEAKKAEKKAAKEAKKETKKEPAKEPEKKVDKNADIEDAVVVEETKTETKAKEPEKAPEQVAAEETKPAKKTKIGNISAAIYQATKGDRLSADRQVEFLGLIKSQYLDKASEIPAEQLAAYTKIFNEGMAMNCLFLHNQIMKEGAEILGVKLDDRVGPVLITLLEECWGVTARALPSSNDGQLRLEFDIPEDVKEAIDADVAAVEEVAKEVEKNSEKTFPDPDPTLPMEEKLKILRAILSQPGNPKTKKEGKDQMTVNIYTGIEWARSAFGLEKDTPSQILAVMFEKLYKNEARPTALAGASGRVFGITNTYNNLLTTHAILGNQYSFTGYSDEEVANIFKVLFAHHLRYIAGKNLASGKPVSTKFTEEEIDKYETEQGYEQLANVPNVVVDAICNGTKLERKLKFLTDSNIDGPLCLTTIAKQYGNSESIAKDIVKKLAPFYAGNIERISKYADLSSYSK